MKVFELADKVCGLSDMDIVVRGEDVVADIAYVTVDHDHGDNTPFLAIDLENEPGQGSKVKAYQIPLLEEGIKIEKIAIPPNTLTCVYCGTNYPEGTPPWGSQVLTDHIKVCKKHPMREVEETNRKLRSALSGLMGSEEEIELKAIAADAEADRDMPEEDKAPILNAIQVFLDTIEE